MTLHSDDPIGIAAAALAAHGLRLIRQTPTSATVSLSTGEHITLTRTPDDPQTATGPGWQAVYHDTTDPTCPRQANLHRAEQTRRGHTATDPAADARKMAAEVAAAVLSTQGAPKALSSRARAAAHTRAGTYRDPAPQDPDPAHTVSINGVEVAVHLDAVTEALTVAIDTEGATDLVTERDTVALRLLVNGQEVAYLP